MRHFKRFVHALLKAGLFAAFVWSATDEERAQMEAAAEVEEDDDDDDVMERDAAYLTTGLITAARAITKAHEAGERCTPHHEAIIDLLSSIDNGVVAVRVIQHLVDIVSQAVDDDDVQRMVTSIIHTELGVEDDDTNH